MDKAILEQVKEDGGRPDQLHDQCGAEKEPLPPFSEVIIKPIIRTYETRRFEPLIIPIPIRADLTIRIAGLPLDLTQAEAAKIGAVVMALADAARSASPLPTASDKIPGTNKDQSQQKEGSR